MPARAFHLASVKLVIKFSEHSTNMRAFAAISLLVVVSSVAAQYGGPSYGGPSYGGPSYGGQSAGYGGHGYEEYAEPHYSFAYEVHDSHTGDIKSHKEERKGEHTQGVYYLVEPDGSKRTVEYVVEGKSGFEAKVQREHSKHPSGGYKSGGYSQGGYSQGGYSQGGYSNGGYSQGGYGGASSFSSLSVGSGYNKPSYNEYKPQPSYYKPEPSYYKPEPSYYKPEPSYYKPEPSYKPSYNQPSYSSGGYGSGHATSSISIATHGAKIATQTYHAAPSKQY